MADTPSISNNMTPIWQFGDFHIQFQKRPLIMGIVNVTPDSFSDGGSFLLTERAVNQAKALVQEGAQFIDIGGESTRPGASPVTARDELSRVIPVLEALATEIVVPVSIDTSKAVVARHALEAGASIINDVTGLEGDPEMPGVATDFDAGIIIMHMKGTPLTMQQNPQYDDVTVEVAHYLESRIFQLNQQGIDPSRMVIDPGIGFGKTLAHNLTLLSKMEHLQALRRPICIGHSRKKIIGGLTGRPVQERVFGSIGVALALCNKGAAIFRVHDVAPLRDAMDVFLAIQNGISPDAL